MNASTRTYDALNRPVTDKDGANRTITSAYDAVGRQTSYTDAINGVRCRISTN